ncbi:sialate O-acetylesterase [Fibrisoma limi]|uniref:sialate O-acetylesterase n=1 Tax=Fibrisoma limi TaxID=663275 RepID=UPI000304D503|nr:T9SS type A sorting domain-containing protein [Fibrisoma limi]
MHAFAQLTISYPLPQLVIQRNQHNTAPLSIAGTFSVPVDRIEARLVPINSSTSRPTDWKVVQQTPRNGLYQGTITAPSGLFQLEVRGIRTNKTVSQATVSRVGIGEVFLIAGQSNAMGLPKLGAKGASDRVVSFNAWNRFWNKNNVLESSDKPFPVPMFSQLEANNLIFPTGETAWCWGELGDQIADRYHVPVAFFNVAIPATVAENWSATANGIPAKNIFNSTYWPFLQPYTNLRNALQYYHSSFGIRAILWHHGESDAVPLHTTKDDYCRLVQELIDHSRADFAADLTWVISRCSITPAGPVPNQAIRAAQDSLINRADNNVWAGPDTDTIQSPRPEHGHFENIPNGVQGVSVFARSWNNSLTDSFFDRSKPQQPRQFIQTGLVPTELSAGETLRVPFATIGFESSPDVSVQLLNDRGWYVMEVGQGQGFGPVEVHLPDTLSAGTYRLRVVAINPAMIVGNPTPAFRVTTPGKSGRFFVDQQTEQDSAFSYVYWLTTHEPSGSRFFVERQERSGSFQTIGQVEGIVDGQFSHLYSFAEPLDQSGSRIYRVRLELPDGSVQYSTPLILAVPDEALPQPLVYPNPSDGTSFTVQLPRSGTWTLSLTDLNGRMVWHQTHEVRADQPQTVWLPMGLADGLYILQCQWNNQRHSQRLLIRH